RRRALLPVRRARGLAVRFHNLPAVDSSQPPELPLRLCALALTSFFVSDHQSINPPPPINPFPAPQCARQLAGIPHATHSLAAVIFDWAGSLWSRWRLNAAQSSPEWPAHAPPVVLASSSPRNFEKSEKTSFCPAPDTFCPPIWGEDMN